jgi:hypothetical protein
LSEKSFREVILPETTSGKLKSGASVPNASIVERVKVIFTALILTRLSDYADSGKSIMRSGSHNCQPLW